MKKRIFAGLLALCLTVNLMPATVFATETPALPKADVTDLGTKTLEAGEYSIFTGSTSDILVGEEPLDLDIVVNFSATDTAETSYDEWFCDFYVTITGIENGSFDATGCYLAGNYDHGLDEYIKSWVVIPLDGMVIEEGVVYPIVSVYDPQLTYREVWAGIKSFTAAIHVAPETFAANPNMKIELALKMKNPDTEELLQIGKTMRYEADGTFCAHEIAAVAAKAATCSSTGVAAHYKCGLCGKLYSDAAGTTELTDVTIPALAHSYEIDLDGAGHWSVCKVCGATTAKVDHSYKEGRCSCGYAPKVEVSVPETVPVPETTQPTTTTQLTTTTQPTATTQPTTTTTPSTEETTTAQPVETPVEEVVVDTKIVEEVATEEVKAAVKETVTVAEVKKVEKETGTVTEVKVAVTTETVDKVIENTEAGATVILPLTEVAEEGQAVTEAEVAVGALKKIVEAEAALTVEFEGVKVTFEPETIKAITEQAQGSVIELRVVPVEHHELHEEQQAVLEEHDVAVRVSAQIFCDGEYIGDFKGGKARIAIPFTPEEGKAIEHHKVYFVDDNGEMTLMPSTYVDGHMVLETTHFSDYVIVYEEVAEVEEESAVVEEVETEEAVVGEVQTEAGLPIVPIIIVIVVVIAIVAFFLTKKKSSEE